MSYETEVGTYFDLRHIGKPSNLKKNDLPAAEQFQSHETDPGTSYIFETIGGKLTLRGRRIQVAFA